MTAFSTAITVVFTSLGLVALALVLLVRRFSASALAIGVVGLIGLITASIWIIFGRPETDPRAIDNLKGEIAAWHRDLQSLREQVQGLAKRLEALEAENDRIPTDLSAAQARLRAAQQEFQVKVAELEKKTKAIPRQNVRQMLANRLDTSFYISQLLEQRSLVAGLTGSWYVMRLRLGGKPFVFADGQFRISDAVQEVKESALQLQTEVLGPVAQAAKSTRLFLRGGADYRRLVSTPEVPEIQELLVLPRLSDGSYARVPRRLRPAAPVRNEDLPNLRADWLRQNIEPVLTYGSADIQILENPPAADQERTVDLILYVDW
jgi:Skp family chaperone for outer membrane proteins